MNSIHDDPGRFISQVWIRDELYGEAVGRSMKAAEQAVAQIAYQTLVAADNSSNNSTEST